MIIGPVIHSVILGYGHRARSGKDTAASIIIKERGAEFDIRRYSFASELKAEVNHNAMKAGGMKNLFADGLRLEGCGYMQENEELLRLPEWVQMDPSPDMSDPECPYGKQRSLLQFWGTNLRRSVNENYWLNKVKQRIADEKPQIALITDLRFLNEVNFILTYGEVIRIDRPGLPPLSEAHESERALANYDGWSDIIKNNGSLDDFKEKVLFSFDMLMSTVPQEHRTEEPKGTVVRM